MGAGDGDSSASCATLHDVMMRIGRGSRVERWTGQGVEYWIGCCVTNLAGHCDSVTTLAVLVQEDLG